MRARRDDVIAERRVTAFRPQHGAVDAAHVAGPRGHDEHVAASEEVLGAGWAILQPLATMIVFSLFFSRVAQPAADGPPFPFFTIWRRSGPDAPWRYVAE